MNNPNPTVRIGQQAYLTLKDLSARSGESMQLILDRAVESERRRRFVEEANSTYERLRQDQKAWDRMVAERQDWDGTLLDGVVTGRRSAITKRSNAGKRRRKD